MTKIKAIKPVNRNKNSLNNKIDLNKIDLNKIEPKIFNEYKILHKFSDNDISEQKNIKSIKLHSGSQLIGIDELIDTLYSIRDKNITIIPDYDVDGIMAGLINKISLYEFGFKTINLYYPKTSLGYGMSKASVDEVMELWPDTEYILTCDNGINTKTAVDYAYSLGVKTIVTDHHVGNIELYPDKALAVVNPNRVDKEETYPFKGISGAEVSWKIMQEYAIKYKPEKLEVINSLEVAAGITIISDVMPVINENRKILYDTYNILSDEQILLKNALRMDVTPYYKQFFYSLYNLLKFLKESGDISGEFNYDSIGFVICPLLNSARRMKSESKLGFRVFETMGNEFDLAVRELRECNRQRKIINNKAKDKFNMEAQKYSNKNGIVYRDDSIGHGIVGLVSGHISNTLSKPNVVLTKSNKLLVGSGRAPEGYDLLSILININKENPNIFVSFGGHKQAAGLSIKEDNYNEFIKLFNKYAIKDENYTNEKLMLTLDENSYYTIDEIKASNKEFDKIKPFSSDVPAPIFKFTFSLKDVSEISKLNNKKDSSLPHLKLKFNNFNKMKNFEVLIWSGYNAFMQLDDDSIISVENELTYSEYGLGSIQITSNSFKLEN